MSWFWPFRKNTEPPASVGSVTVGSTPEPSPAVVNDPAAPSTEPSSVLVAENSSEKKVPASLQASCAFVTCGVPSAYCVPFALSSCLPFGPFWSTEKKVAEPLATPPLEIRSPESETQVKVVNETVTASGVSVPDAAPAKENPTQASSP